MMHLGIRNLRELMTIVSMMIYTMNRVHSIVVVLRIVQYPFWPFNGLDLFGTFDTRPDLVHKLDQIRF
jgi:hypothetical protein